MPAKPELRKTKIIATIGPACDDLETLKAMLLAGMNVARLNLSFGTSPEQHERVERIREAAEAVGRNVGIMIDTRGIEIRTEKLDGGAVDLAPGEVFTLRTDGKIGDATGVSITYRNLPAEVSAGTPILLDDGAIELDVHSVTAASINCRVVHGGRLGENGTEPKQAFYATNLYEEFFTHGTRMRPDRLLTVWRRCRDAGREGACRTGHDEAVELVELGCRGG